MHKNEAVLNISFGARCISHCSCMATQIHCL